MKSTTSLKNRVFFILIVCLGFNLWACRSDAQRVGQDHPYAKEINALTPLQFRVTQKDGTERPFKNTYWDHKEPGIYVDIVSGEALFSSTHKFVSGTGWPSFTQPIQPGVLREVVDIGPIGKRIEVRSSKADSHLGHVFNDGPNPTGLRYCINSAALRFVPLKDMKSQGYESFLSLFTQPLPTEVKK